MMLFSRFVRMFKADLHGVMDRLEDKQLLVRQYLREMEAELDRLETKRKAAAATREQPARDRDRALAEAEKTNPEIDTAITQQNDDIARFLIRKKKRLAGQAETLRLKIEKLDDEIRGLNAETEEKRLRFDDLKQRASAFLRKTSPDTVTAEFDDVFPEALFSEPSDEEVELELLVRKEARKGEAT